MKTNMNTKMTPMMKTTTNNRIKIIMITNVKSYDENYDEH